MTKGRKFKKEIRERMAITGESYTKARFELLKSKPAPVEFCPKCKREVGDCGCPGIQESLGA